MRRQNGFTLVELSIVLVIIGLLIGGILVAQSMISTSKLTAVIMQIQQFDAGVENFKTKYKYLPGDAPAFNGDGDGAIDWSATSGTPTTVVGFDCEIANFWFNVFPDQYTGATCEFPVTSNPPTTVTTATSTKNVPTSKLGKNGSYFIASGITTDSLNAVLPGKNYYAIMDPSQTDKPNWYQFATTSTTNSAVNSADMLALDKKIDDGVAGTGNVLSGAIGNDGFWDGGIVATPIAQCNYNLTTIDPKAYTCTPLIRIGSQTGDPS